MENYDTSLKYAEIAATSGGTAIDKYGAYLGGVEAHMNTLKASFEALSMSLLNTTALNGVVDAGSGILNILNAVISSDIVEGIGVLNIALLATAAILGGSTTLGLNAFAGALTKAGIASTGLATSLSVLLPVAAVMLAIAGLKAVNVTLDEQKQKLSTIQSSYASVSGEIDVLSGKLSDGTIKPFEQARLDFLQKYKAALQESMGTQERAVMRSQLSGAGDMFSGGGYLGELSAFATANPEYITKDALRRSDIGDSRAIADAQSGFDQLVTAQARIMEIQSAFETMLTNPSIAGDQKLSDDVKMALDFAESLMARYESGITSIVDTGLVSYQQDVIETGSAAIASTEQYATTLSDLRVAINGVTTQSSALSDALKQQETDGYLSEASMKALSEAGIDVGTAIEKDNDTFRINSDLIQETISQNAQYEWSLIQLKKATALKNLEQAESDDADEGRIKSLKNEVALYEELASQLESTMSVMSQYKSAIETANASADYDYGTGTIFKTITDGLESGRIATDEFKAAMSFFTDGKFGDNITQKDIPAIQAFVDSISGLTQGGAAGLNEATKRMGDLLDADGMFKSGTTLTDVAAKLGKNVGTEFAYSLLKSYEDYGFDVNLEQIMRPEDWSAVADTVLESADGFTQTYQKLIGLRQDLQDAQHLGNTEEATAIGDQIRNLSTSLKSDDIVTTINSLQALLDSGNVSGSKADSVVNTIKDLNGLLGFKSQMDAIPIEAEDLATPVISAVTAALNALDGKRARTFVDVVVSGGGVQGAYADLSKTPGGIGRASGNANARGTWGRGSGGRTLVGELGPEIVVDPATNRWYTVGDRGAQFANLPQNAIVFNHQQTQSILSQGRLGSRGKALAGGSAAYNRFKDDSDITFGSFGSTYMVTSNGGITPIPGASSKPGKGKPTQEAVSLSKVYENEVKLLEMQIKLTNDLLNMYETGTANWFSQQQYIIDNYKRQAVLAQAEYDRLIASGADIKSEEVQAVLQSLVGYRKEIFEASKDYWEAEKDNANSTLEHMKAQAQAVMDLQESYHDLTKSIQAEQRSIDSELRIASEAYPNLTSSEREAAFSGDDYRLLSNRLAVIAAEAANMQADYMQQIKDVGEESSYELESITDEFQKQYELKLDAYNIAKNDLAVLKAKKNLENVQSERSVAMLIGGMWTWVADAEAVADAMRGVTDAQQELADAQSDATFNAEQANISGVINQIDNQIGAIDALVYSSDALAGEVHSLVATIQDQVLAAMSPSSAAMLASLPMYAGTSTGLFGTSSLQSLLAASLSGSGATFTPMSSLGVDLSSILGNMGSVRPSISVSSSPTGDIVSIGQLTITGAVASQFIALLRSVAPLG